MSNHIKNVNEGVSPKSNSRTLRRFFWSFVTFYLLFFLVPHYVGMKARGAPEWTRQYYPLSTTAKWAGPIALIASAIFTIRMAYKDQE